LVLEHRAEQKLANLPDELRGPFARLQIGAVLGGLAQQPERRQADGRQALLAVSRFSKESSPS
jgi:hypothetical protein